MDAIGSVYQHSNNNAIPGKLVSGNLYVHYSLLLHLSPELVTRIAQATELTGLKEEQDYNVIKFHQNRDDLSLLSYPRFFEEGFPTLAKSWRVSLTRSTVLFRTYEESRNPPILHRKELLIPSNDSRVAHYQALTIAAESLGLFNDTSRIGTREYWFALIAERGYELIDHELVPIANEKFSQTETFDVEIDIKRHLTALSRANFSAPVQALLRHRLIDADRSFFDYGCGRGDDVKGLLAHAINASGWDPHYAADQEKRRAAVVNIGFVINVIEDLAERVEALEGAYAFTTGVLSVAAMLSSQAPPDGRVYRDGYLSSRNTFQKYYTQSQLRDFIEETLDEPAIATGPGIFLVFRDKALELRFLTQRYGKKARSNVLNGWAKERIQRESKLSRFRSIGLVKPNRETILFEAHRETFLALWLICLDLGRLPTAIDLPPNFHNAVNSNIGSLHKALRILIKHFNQEELERTASQKRANLLVFCALQQFEKRKPYKHFDESVQRDIRHFFGDYATLIAFSRDLLYEVADITKLDAACNEAAEKGYGWLEDSHSLQVHSSLLERLPVPLRIYVGCATAIYGDASDFDLIKIHIRSGKVTLMKFDNFIGAPLPRMTQRIKVKLREQDLDIFDYGENYPCPLLYYKSRFINEEFPHFEEQIAFEEHLDRLSLHDLQGYGPTAEDFYLTLQKARWTVQGFSLLRSSSSPDLDSTCGAHFTYRQLIECGETQHRTSIGNVPREPDTYTALLDLAVHILDPVIEYFGMIQLTYGFCSSLLAKQIKGRIAPHLDQHAGHERNSRGKVICDRLGAACDFMIVDENMEEVAIWVMENTPVDRLYFYGPDRPIHVSYSMTPARQLVRFKEAKGGRLVPIIDRQHSGGSTI